MSFDEPLRLDSPWHYGCGAPKVIGDRHSAPNHLVGKIRRGTRLPSRQQPRRIAREDRILQGVVDLQAAYVPDGVHHAHVEGIVGA